MKQKKKHSPAGTISIGNQIAFVFFWVTFDFVVPISAILVTVLVGAILESVLFGSVGMGYGIRSVAYGFCLFALGITLFALFKAIMQASILQHTLKFPVYGWWQATTFGWLIVLATPMLVIFGGWLILQRSIPFQATIMTDIVLASILVAAATLPSVLQWRLLRHRVNAAWWWIVSHALGVTIIVVAGIWHHALILDSWYIPEDTRGVILALMVVGFTLYIALPPIVMLLLTKHPYAPIIETNSVESSEQQYFYGTISPPVS